MAQIIAIAKDTYRDGVNEIGDIVDIYDDDVELGPAYDTFTIIAIPGLRASQIKTVISSLVPEFDITDDGIECWYNDSDRTWYRTRRTCQHQVSLRTLDAVDLATLASSRDTANDKLNILRKLQIVVTREAENTLEPRV